MLGVVLWFINRALTGGPGETDTGVWQAVEHPDDD